MGGGAKKMKRLSSTVRGLAAVTGMRSVARERGQNTVMAVDRAGGTGNTGLGEHLVKYVTV